MPELTEEEEREVDALRKHNALLITENHSLKEQLNAERCTWMQSTDDSHHALQANMYEKEIRLLDKDAEVIALRSELAKLRQQCMRYGEAMEETRSNFLEMKRLYTDLGAFLSSGPKPTVAEELQ